MPQLRAALIRDDVELKSHGTSGLCVSDVPSPSLPGQRGNFIGDRSVLLDHLRRLGQNIGRLRQQACTVGEEGIGQENRVGLCFPGAIHGGIGVEPVSKLHCRAEKPIGPAPGYE